MCANETALVERRERVALQHQHRLGLGLSRLPPRQGSARTTHLGRHRRGKTGRITPAGKLMRTVSEHNGHIKDLDQDFDRTKPRNTPRRSNQGLFDAETTQYRVYGICRVRPFGRTGGAWNGVSGHLSWHVPPRASPQVVDSTDGKIKLLSRTAGTESIASRMVMDCIYMSSNSASGVPGRLPKSARNVQSGFKNSFSMINGSF